MVRPSGLAHYLYIGRFFTLYPRIIVYNSIKTNTTNQVGAEIFAALVVRELPRANTAHHKVSDTVQASYVTPTISVHSNSDIH